MRCMLEPESFNWSHFTHFNRRPNDIIFFFLTRSAKCWEHSLKRNRQEDCQDLHDEVLYISSWLHQLCTAVLVMHGWPHWSLISRLALCNTDHVWKCPHVESPTSRWGKKTPPNNFDLLLGDLDHTNVIQKIKIIGQTVYLWECRQTDTRDQ